MNELEVKYRTIKLSREVNSGSNCIIDSRVHGLFATFYCVLYGLYICEREKITPIIYLGKEHLYYDPTKGENIFEYFYNQNSSVVEDNCCRMVVDNPLIFLGWCRNSMNEKRISNFLLNKYFILNDNIKSSMDLFAEKNFEDKKVLGVHYRGRDKVTETRVVPFDEYEVKIYNMLESGICDKFFLVTDEFKIRNLMAKKYPNEIILYDLEADYSTANSESNAGLHFLNTQSPYLMAKDALMECYLLSYCNLFMSSFHSSMSLFTTFINPEIPHIIIEP